MVSAQNLYATLTLLFNVLGEISLSVRTNVIQLPLWITFTNIVSLSLQSWQYSNVSGYGPMALVNSSSISCNCAYGIMSMLQTMALKFILLRRWSISPLQNFLFQF